MISLEACLNKIVHCSDGGYRRLIKFDERHCRYEVPTTKNCWVDMGSTPRSEVEERFINGVVVEEVP